MKLRRIETTPNPNCMMLKVDADFGRQPLTFRADDADLGRAPDIAQALLAVDGVQEVFLSRDFITITRRGGADWRPILAAAGEVLGQARVDGGSPVPGSPVSPEAPLAVDPDRAEIAVLGFRGIPGQVRVSSAERQARVALPHRFSETLARVLAATNGNYLKERAWRALEPRFGDPAEIAQMVADEIDSSISDDELARLAEAAITGAASGSVARERRSRESLLADLASADWRLRLAAIQRIQVDDESLPAILDALSDDKTAVRRWAAAVLGSSKRAESVPPLCDAVGSDASVLVRRAAGDALSDLGSPAAIPAMCTALADPSHLVRWRAARFLNEQGDATAVGALRVGVAQEPDFGVRMEMSAALERIEGGGEAQVPMWLRIARGNRPE